MSVKIKKGIVTGNENQNIPTLAEALAEEAKCGCGQVCNSCYSYIVLWDYDSNTNTRSQIALYVKDGVLVLDTVENAEADQKAILEG